MICDFYQICAAQVVRYLTHVGENNFPLSTVISHRQSVGEFALAQTFVTISRPLHSTRNQSPLSCSVRSLAKSGPRTLRLQYLNSSPYSSGELWDVDLRLFEVRVWVLREDRHVAWLGICVLDNAEQSGSTNVGRHHLLR